MENTDLNKTYEELDGKTLGEVLLTPTKIYVKPMLALFKEMTPHAVMHITGGGFYENIPRALPEGMSAKIYKDELEIPGIFKLLMKKGNIPERDMFNTYNMGTVSDCCSSEGRCGACGGNHRSGRRACKGYR